MLDDYKIEQPIAFKIMKNTVVKNRISHAYLVEANGYSKKNELAFSFAKYLLCNKHHLKYDETCPICHHLTFENILDIKKINAEGNWIKKNQLEQLQEEFNIKSINGGKKIYIIEDADKLNIASSNSILKFLEEPEENIIAILIVDNLYQLLPTIISRCQIIHLMNDKPIEDLQDEEERNRMIENKEKILSFCKYLEQNKKETLLYENKLWHSQFSSKEEVENALTLLLHLYKDCLNFLLNKNLDYFGEYKNNIVFFTQNNTEKQICSKINIILEKREQLKVNINLNMLIDDLIIKISEV